MHTSNACRTVASHSIISFFRILFWFASIMQTFECWLAASIVEHYQLMNYVLAAEFGECFLTYIFAGDILGQLQRMQCMVWPQCLSKGRKRGKTRENELWISGNREIKETEKIHAERA